MSAAIVDEHLSEGDAKCRRNFARTNDKIRQNPFPFVWYCIYTFTSVRKFSKTFHFTVVFSFRTNLVKDHLEVFLEEAQRLTPEPQHIKEVCFLCIQCMEVSL